MTEVDADGVRETSQCVAAGPPSHIDGLARRLVQLERQRRAVAQQLRDETAQVLSYVLLRLAAAEEGKCDSIFEEELHDLQETLRKELQRVLVIIEELTSPSPGVAGDTV
jgi:signal transduction histidine kinase